MPGLALGRTGALLAIIVTVLVSGTPAAAERLPLLAAPEHYALHFDPDLRRERFEGHAVIRLRILSPTRKLVLHAAGLEFTGARVVTGSIEQGAVVSADPKAETATFYVPVDLRPGLAELHVSYSGVLNRQLRGFYISEANGRKYAATQLETTDARRMFPSFDEPIWKATFDVSVVVREGDEAISNGAIESVAPGPLPGTKRIDFATTGRMSSYLVALAVGDFECVEDKVRSLPVRVCATPGKKPLMAFAMDATKASLEYFNRYFAIDYPFGKLDMVAIPDFAAGAMENTGAVFFRESLLLVARDASLAARRRAALVIAHELAHQWFGNLVTMRWWDDLWLNEGFATWMETKAVAAWQPGWNVELEQRQATQSAMTLDALLSTRAVRMRAETPDEINELFDPIAYEKAAALLAMVEAYVGESAFRTGVNAYIYQYQYDNAAAENFWNVLTRATSQPIDQIMRSFVEQPGLPLVTVNTSCEGDETIVSLSQERFLGAADPGSRSQLWSIPVCVGTRGDAAADWCEVLDQRQETIRLPACARWVVANTGAEGYYRTAYGAGALGRLADANASLEPEERLMLLADTWALVRARRSGVAEFLDVLSSVATDIEEPSVLEAAAARLQFLHEYVATGETRDELERWVKEEFAPLLGPHRWIRSADEQVLRTEAALLALLGAVGRDPEVIADARTMVEDYLASPPPGAVPPTVLNAIVPLAALEGGAGLYEKYRARAEAAETPEERYRFLYGLAAFREPHLLRRTFDYALSPRVRTQDRALLIAALLGTREGRDVVWSLVQARWSDLQDNLSPFGGTGRIVEALGNFCDRSRLREIRQFFQAHPVPAAERTLQQALEDIERCAAIVKSQGDELDAWLAGEIASSTRWRNSVIDTRSRRMIAASSCRVNRNLPCTSHHGLD